MNSVVMLPLRRFELTLSATDDLNPTYLEPHRAPVPLVPAEQYLDKFAPAGFAQRISDQVPSLRHITVSIEEPRKRKLRRVQCSRDESGKVSAIGF